jgi:response regulator RpfG family c-di-GMP phosphodiesterase
MAVVQFGPEARRPRPHILVVEDDRHIRDFCRLLLDQEYNVATVTHGQEAVTALNQTSYDLVLTDLHMPVMSGIDLIHHIRRHHPDTDTVVITAHATVDTAREALKLGALDYLSKPIESESLERTIRTSLELRRVRREKEQLSDLVFMYQFSQSIAATLDPETQTRLIVDFLWKRYAPAHLALSLLEPHGRRLRLLAIRPDLSEQVTDEVTVASSYDDHALVHAHTVLSGADPLKEDSHAFGIVLRSHDRPVGCLHLIRTGDQPPFDAGERRVLGIFTSQIAASLDNARLYQALIDQNRQTIEALAGAIEARDTYTSGHSRRVTHYAVRLAQALDLNDRQCELIHYASLLHDIGKIGIRDYVLLKPGPLSEEEFAVMRDHPEIGVKIIERVSGLHETLPIIRAHHERIDGSGYPYGLAGQDIPFAARILSIADAFEAMTSNRAYRPAMPINEALAILEAGRGTKWDTELVNCFITLIRQEGALTDAEARLEVDPLLPRPNRKHRSQYVSDVRD